MPPPKNQKEKSPSKEHQKDQRSVFALKIRTRVLNSQLESKTATFSPKGIWIFKIKPCTPPTPLPFPDFLFLKQLQELLAKLNLHQYSMSPEKGNKIQTIFNTGGSKESLEAIIILRTEKRQNTTKSNLLWQNLSGNICTKLTYITFRALRFSQNKESLETGRGLSQLPSEKGHGLSQMLHQEKHLQSAAEQQHTTRFQTLLVNACVGNVAVNFFHKRQKRSVVTIQQNKTSRNYKTMANPRLVGRRLSPHFLTVKWPTMLY